MPMFKRKQPQCQSFEKWRQRNVYNPKKRTLQHACFIAIVIALDTGAFYIKKIIGFVLFLRRDNGSQSCSLASVIQLHIWLPKQQASYGCRSNKLRMAAEATSFIWLLKQQASYGCQSKQASYGCRSNKLHMAAEATSFIWLLKQQASYGCQSKQA